MLIHAFKKYQAVIFLSVLTCTLLGFAACKSGSSPEHAGKISVDRKLLDSLQRTSDSTYSKPYFSRDFATAVYFVNKRDSTIAQVMKDKDSVIRQVIITRGKKRIYATSYFSNGQLMEDARLDSYGQPDGPAKEYSENGMLRRRGTYRSGLRLGIWENFDSTGKVISTDEYDKDGQVIQHKEE